MTLAPASTPPALDEAQALASVPTGLLVGGHRGAGASGASFAVEDPATGATLCSVADAEPADAIEALAAAAAAQDEWARTPARTRAEILRRAYDLVSGDRDRLALLMALESGKPLAEAHGEVAYGADFLLWCSEEAARIAGRYGPAPRGDGRILVNRRPVGPCVFVTPWNFPLAMATRKVAPALAAGCTVVLKPAEQTPLTALAFAALMEQAGLPPAVLNVVPTTRPRELVAGLLGDERARKVSFTGSTAVGRELMRGAAEHVMRVSMELGGNAPLIVFEDADVDVAVAGALVAKMRNTGQSCIGANRIMLAEPIAEAFTERFVAAMGALVPARGTDPAATAGPLIDRRARDRVAALVDDARERGAEVLLGGAVGDDAGHWYAPTVLAGVPAGARVLTEEIFGPVAPLVTFADEDEALAAANATMSGLAAYVFTRDLDRALRAVDALEAGLVGVNRGLVSNAAAPFGGVKHSGLGREGGSEGVEEYLESTYVALP